MSLRPSSVSSLRRKLKRTAQWKLLKCRISPNGRYFYFNSPQVGGVPGGAFVSDGGEVGGPADYTSQIYRYDSLENVIQCMSCASPSDQEPKLNSLFTNRHGSSPNETPTRQFVTADGSRAFFETPAALVPEDVDGEVPPEVRQEGHESYEYSSESGESPSSDVYEWRRQGLDGCVRLQGCLALITSGRGGYLNILLGIAGEGSRRRP